MLKDDCKAVSKARTNGVFSLRVNILLSRTGPDAIEADIFTSFVSKTWMYICYRTSDPSYSISSNFCSAEKKMGNSSLSQIIFRIWIFSAQEGLIIFMSVFYCDMHYDLTSLQAVYSKKKNTYIFHPGICSSVFSVSNLDVLKSFYEITFRYSHYLKFVFLTFFYFLLYMYLRYTSKT